MLCNDSRNTAQKNGDRYRPVQKAMGDEGFATGIDGS